MLAGVVLCLLPLTVAAGPHHVPESPAPAPPHVQAAVRTHQSWRTHTAPRPSRPCKKKSPLAPRAGDCDDDNDNNDDLSRPHLGGPLPAAIPTAETTAVCKSAPPERSIAAPAPQPLYLTQLCLLI